MPGTGVQSGHALDGQHSLTQAGAYCRVAKDKQQEAQELVRNRRMAIVQLQEIIALAKSIRT